MDDTLRGAPSEGQVTDPRGMREVLVTAPPRLLPRAGSGAEGRAAGPAYRAMCGDGCPLQPAAVAWRGPAPERPRVHARSGGRPWRDPRSGPASRSAGAAWRRGAGAKTETWRWRAGPRIPGH